MHPRISVCWDDLRFFLAIARDGQMLSTAGRLGVSQSQLSRRMMSLEGALGFKVLNRTGHGCTVTEEGLALLKAVEQMEGHIDLATERLGLEDTAVEGTVRIASEGTFGALLLAPHMHVLTDQNPDLKVSLQFSSDLRSLSDTDVDVAIADFRPADPKWSTHRLGTFEQGLYTAKSYVIAAGMPKSDADFKHHAFVRDAAAHVRSGAGPEIPRGLDKSRLQVEVATPEGKLGAIMSGAGIGFLPNFVAAMHPELLHVLPEYTSQCTYWIATPRQHKVMKRVRAVLRFLEAITGDNSTLTSGARNARSESDQT